MRASFRLAVLPAIIAALAACAKPPEAIAPAYISTVAYRGMTCAELAREQARTAAALAASSEAQSNARTYDTVGVIFLGLPVASLAGSNVSGQVARHKGEDIALRQAMSARNCTL